MKHRPLLIALALLAAASPAVARDCHHVRGAAETAICQDPAIAKADARLNQLYRIVREHSSPAEKRILLVDQRRWLAKRDRCGQDDPDCLQDAYDARIKQLTGDVILICDGIYGYGHGELQPAWCAAARAQ